MKTPNYSLSIAIMHCPYYAERQLIVKRIINQIGHSNILNKLEDFAVIEDWKKKGVWHNGKKSWEFCLSTKATHHLVLQDDIILCEDFLPTVKKLIEVFPNKIMSLYANRKICEEAKLKNIRWVEISDGTWGQALLFPREQTKLFLVWEKNNILENFKSFDARAAIYCVKNNVTPLCPMPSLVNHLLPSNSTLGYNNKKRVARWFEEKKSYLQYNWSKTKKLKDKSTLNKTYENYLK